MIQVQALTKRFGSDSAAVLAVDHVSFQVRVGEIFGLLGPNGAGKTTTLRMILGLLQPTSGDVVVDGYRVSEHPAEIKQRVGLVSTSAGLYQWLTVRETLEFFGDVYRVDRGRQRDQIARLTRWLDLGGLLDRRCGPLSTGQKQRVNLARALMHDPPVVLMDEPTRGLDIVGTQIVFEYMRFLQQQGKSILLCTHRLDEAERFATRFGLLHRGRLELTGTLLELQQQTGHASLVDVFVGLLGPQGRLTSEEAFGQGAVAGATSEDATHAAS